MLNGKMPGFRSCLILLLALFCPFFQPLLIAEPSTTTAVPHLSFNRIEASCLTTTLPPELTDQKLSTLFPHYPLHIEDQGFGYTLHKCRFHFYFPGVRSAAATIPPSGLPSGESFSATWQTIRQVSLMLMTWVFYQKPSQMDQSDQETLLFPEYEQTAVTQPSDITTQHPPSHAYCYSGESDSTCPAGHCPLVSLCLRHPCHHDDGDDNDPTSDHTYNPTEYCPKCGTTPCQKAYPDNWGTLLYFDYEWLFKEEEEEIVDVVSIQTLSTSAGLSVSTHFELESLFCTEEESGSTESMDIFPDWESFINFEINPAESAYSSGETSSSEELCDSGNTSVSEDTSDSEEPCDSEDTSDSENICVTEDIRNDDNYSPNPHNRITRVASHNRPRLLLLPFLWHLIDNGEHPDIIEWCDKDTGLFRVLSTPGLTRLWNINKWNKENKVSYDNLSRSMRNLQRCSKGLVPLKEPKICHFQFDLKHPEVSNLQSQSRQASHQDKSQSKQP